VLLEVVLMLLTGGRGERGLEQQQQMKGQGHT